MSYTTSSGQKAALPLQGLDARVLVLIGVHRGGLVGRRLAVVEPCKHAVHLPAAEFFTPKSPKTPQHLEALHRLSAAQRRERTAGRLAQAMLGCFLQAPSPKRPRESRSQKRLQDEKLWHRGHLSLLGVGVRKRSRSGEGVNLARGFGSSSLQTRCGSLRSAFGACWAMGSMGYAGYWP